MYIYIKNILLFSIYYNMLIYFLNHIKELYWYIYINIYISILKNYYNNINT